VKTTGRGAGGSVPHSQSTVNYSPGVIELLVKLGHYVQDNCEQFFKSKISGEP